MLVTTKAIVFSAIKYKDSSLIVKCLTREDGIQSYLIRGVYKSKRGGLRPALFQPLTLLEITSNHKKDGGLNFIKEARVYSAYSTIQTNIYKNTIAQFLSEILSIVIKEEEENKPLFDYIESAMMWLDEHDHSANFHLLFLLNLTSYLGCYPDTSNMHYDYFNLETGNFEVSRTSNHSIFDKKLTVLKSFLGIKFDALENVKLTAKDRNEFLLMVLDYFNLHLFDFKKPRSLEILSKIFN